MTREQAIKYINSIEYKYITNDLMYSDYYPYKEENLILLESLSKEIKSLRIYKSINKFRLIRLKHHFKHK